MLFFGVLLDFYFQDWRIDMYLVLGSWGKVWEEMSGSITLISSSGTLVVLSDLNLL